MTTAPCFWFLFFPRGSEDEILARAAVEFVLARIENRCPLGQKHAGTVQEVAGPETKIVDALVKRAAGGPFAKEHLQRDVVVIERRPTSDQDVIVRAAEQPIVARSTNEHVQARAADQTIVARVAGEDVIAVAALKRVVPRTAV